jgi:hypothetical protein
MLLVEKEGTREDSIYSLLFLIKSISYTKVRIRLTHHREKDDDDEKPLTIWIREACMFYSTNKRQYVYLSKNMSDDVFSFMIDRIKQDFQGKTRPMENSMTLSTLV